VNITESPAGLETASTAGAASHGVPSGENDGDLDPFSNPYILIEAKSPRVRFDLRQLWVYRELLYFLIWRDIKIRYKQTLLGAGWAIIQPLFTMLLFSLFFGKLARIPSDGVPYPLFAYAGLLPWTFFANAFGDSSSSLVSNPSLLTKLYFPRMLIPVAAVGVDLLDLVLGVAVFGAFMAYYGVSPGFRLLLLPLAVLLCLALVLGLGLALSAMHVKYRDLRYALPFAVQLLMFASPLIYAPALVPKRWQWALDLNPLTGLIESFRYALIGRPRLNFAALGSSVAIACGALLTGLWYFQRRQADFADIV